MTTWAKASLLISATSLFIRSACAQTCYWPNGGIAENHSPCNTSAVDNEGSACCDNSGSVCTTTGLCQSSNFFPYRGSCTDRTWNSPQCAQRCVTTHQNSYCNIVSCIPVGEWGNGFCCMDKGNESCCDSTFFNPIGDPFSFPLKSVYHITNTTSASADNSTTSSPGTADPATSPSSTADSSAPGPSTSAAPKSKDKSVAIGVGIGVPLGILLVSALGFLLYRERKLRRKAETLAQQGGNWVPEDKKHYIRNPPQELEVDSYNNMPAELGSRQVSELGKGK